MTFRLKKKKNIFPPLYTFLPLTYPYHAHCPLFGRTFVFTTPDQVIRSTIRARHRKYKPPARAFMKYNIILSRIVICAFIRFNFLFRLNNITY